MPGSTQVDVFNLALSRLAVKPVTTVNESTVMATVLSRLWNFARRNCLSQTNWSFAKVSGATLVLDSTGYTPPAQWLYAYTYPSNAVAVWKVYNPAMISDPLLIQDPVINPINPPLANVAMYLGLGEKFEHALNPANGGQLIHTNCQSALAEYTYDVTDTTVWADNFVDSMGYFLAAHAAMPLTGDPELMKSMGAAASSAFSEARRLNKSEDNSEKFGDGSIINSRA